MTAEVERGLEPAKVTFFDQPSVAVMKRAPLTALRQAIKPWVEILAARWGGGGGLDDA